jgi:predicted permease
MSMLARLYTVIARLRGFVRPRAGEAEFEQELAAHLTAAEEDAVRRGLTREEARRLARVQLGGLTQLREASREAQGLPWVSTCWLDVKLGVRLLLKYPGLTLVSTMALAIGIAIVAGFHAGTEFMVRPVLPVAQGDRIVAIWNHDVSFSDRGAQTVGDMLAWRRAVTTVEHIGAFVSQERAVSATDGLPRLVWTAQVSASAFEMLRVAPVMGRVLVEEDERPGGTAVALVGYEFWQSALLSDPAIVGKTIRVGEAEHMVIGVMPKGFAFPRREQLWTPLPIPVTGLQPGEGPAIDRSFGRLAPSVTLNEAEAQLQVVGSRLSADHPRTHATLRPRMMTYARSFLEAGEPGLAQMMSAARLLIVIVVLIVAVNVGTLVYARNAARVGEVALRMALGASRRRIAVQMFVEALVLASLAGAVALVVMAWPLHLLREVFATSIAQGAPLPSWWVVRVGPSTMLIIAGLVLLCAVLTGILPALKLTDRQMRSRLQRVQDGVSGLRFGGATSAVTVAQVAISVALLTVAGAQLRTLVGDWMSIDDEKSSLAGYLTAQLRWDTAEPARQAQTWRALGRQLSEEPGVRGVTFDTSFAMRPFQAVSSDAAEPRWSYVVAIEPGYFAVFDTPILAGRAFDATDASEIRRPVAIVNETFVREALSTGDAIGQRVRRFDPSGRGSPGDALEIVGVVRDSPRFEISQRGPAWVTPPTIYVPLTATAAPVRMTVRVRDDPQQFVPRLSAIAAAIDPTLVVHQPRPLERIDSIDLMFLRLYGFGVIFLVFAVLLLATAGVYSMMSFTVAQRTREIGIRTALGAKPVRVVGDVFSRALRQVAAGTALGFAIGIVFSDGPFALSTGAFANGPGLMMGVAAVILATVGLACAIPLRRALCIQPTEALRADS